MFKLVCYIAHRNIGKRTVALRLKVFLLPPANEVWGKVIFSQASVILLTVGGVCLSACWDTPHYQGESRRPAHLQGDPPPGPHLGGIEGIRSRPTAKGRIEGDQIQAQTQGGNSGGSDPGPHPRGKFRGIRSRPTPKGEIRGDQEQTPPTTTTAAGGTHPTGMHSCFKLLSHLTHRQHRSSHFVSFAIRNSDPCK